MQVNKTHLQGMGNKLGLELKSSLTSQAMLDRIHAALDDIHLAILIALPHLPRSGSTHHCNIRLDALKEHARDRQRRRTRARNAGSP